MEKVYHVGLMKSGTTYIQEILSNNRDRLLENKWHYPGKRLNQQHACYSLCGKDIPWVKKSFPPTIGLDLKKNISNSKDNVLISAEALSTLSESGVKKFIKEVGEPTKIIFTLRGLHKILPSAWQQYLKGGGRVTFGGFIERLEEQREDLSGFWRTYAYGHAVRRWAQYADVHAVVVPASSSKKEDLWDLFRSAVSLPEVSLKEVPDEKANLSLDQESAAILRHLNLILPKNAAETNEIRDTYLKRSVFPMTQSQRGSKIKIPKKYQELIQKWNEEELVIMNQHVYKTHGSIQDVTNFSRDEFSSNKMDSNVVAKMAALHIANMIK